MKKTRINFRLDRFSRSLWTVVRMVWKVNPPYTAGLCLVNVLQGMIPVLNLWIIKLIVDAVVRGTAGNRVTQQLALCFSLLFAVKFFAHLIRYMSAYLQSVMGDLVTNSINMMVMEKSVSLDLFYFENPEFHDTLSRAQHEASYKPLVIVNQLFELVRNSITLVSLVAVLVRLHWLAALLVVVMSIPYAFMRQKYAKKGYSLLYGQTQNSRRLYYLTDLLTSVSYIKEIKLFRLGGYLLEKYREVFRKIFAENKHLNRKKNIGLFSASLVSLVNYIGVYFYIVFRAIGRAITIGDLSLYSGAYSQCQEQFSSWIGSVSGLYENHLFINNLFTFLNLKPKISCYGECREIDPRFREGIEFRNVSFRYPGCEEFVFRNLNMKIGGNENIAIVGENGAGKTTLIKLLSRLYDPDEGEILVGGVNIAEYNPVEYQKQIGVIFQDYSHFFLTARENIGIGSIDNIGDFERIRSAARKSGADRVIDRLPQKYESILGRIFDEGCQISIGEWQKVAIARAFMKDGRILILDEPTASLDVRTEHEIFNRFRELTRDKISILISHRLSSVCMVDRIFVLENGGLIENGTHKELMDRNGRYAEMFRMQAEKYFRAGGEEMIHGEPGFSILRGSESMRA